MRCPRCEQEGPVEEREDHTWVCRSCSIRFTEATQVVRPIQPNTVWVERGTGSLVTVQGVEGDPFDPYTAIRFKFDETNAISHVMMSRDFRYYFRAHSREWPAKVSVTCRPHEEWESAGQVYLVLSVNPEGMVHVASIDGKATSFLVPSYDFVKQFRRFIRLTDFERLLGLED